mgnify:CR=1 FL=1
MENNISPNKIILPLSDNKNGILDDYIKTDDKNCQEIFTCSICQCLVWDPVCCSLCDKPFCRSCRFQYGENKKCPFKCNTHKLREITRNEKDYLNKISIKCTNNGCLKYIKYYDYKNHLEKCDFRKYHCNNDPCKEEGFINDMINHSQNCPYRKIICQKCQKFVIFCKYDIHQKSLCPENIIKCKYCQTTMKRGVYLEEHQSNNNSNPNCLRIQIENIKTIYEKKLNEKRTIINNLNNKINVLEKKKNLYKKENVEMKKTIEEMKSFFQNGYNKFISQEKNEINVDKPLNINDEIHKISLTESNKLFLQDEKEIELSKNYEKVASNTGSNFYRPNKINGDIRSLNDKAYLSDRKKPSDLTNENIEKKKIEFSHKFKKVPSLNLLPNYKLAPQKKIFLNKK